MTDELVLQRFLEFKYWLRRSDGPESLIDLSDPDFHRLAKVAFEKGCQIGYVEGLREAIEELKKP